jgi:antitoxin component YwqK of YwqJK toxin-antitoxin module
MRILMHPNQLLLSILVLCSLTTIAQKKEEGFDVSFKRTDGSPRYYVITEQTGNRWHRLAYYVPESSLAMEGWYLDAACEKPDGDQTWFHSNKMIKSNLKYSNGVLSGTAVNYHDNGMMSDSATYEAGKRKGAELKWNVEGMLVDSSNWDGAGNGVQVRWYNDGVTASAGRWTADTAKDNRWKYFHPNGKVLAVEDYDKGKRTAIQCYDINGELLPVAKCEGSEAVFPKGETAWRNFVVKNLNPDVPVRKKAPAGTYLVYLFFVVETDGTLSGFKPETNFGFGMEEEVVRLLKKSPKWTPAMEFGRPVRAYRRQPVTFQITQE